MLTDREELAYLGGYFDGEGSICFLNKKDRHYNSLRLVLSTSDRSILERFAKRFGGDVRECPSLTTKRKMFRWYKDGKHAQDVIAVLIPFLHGKLYPAVCAMRLVLDYPKGMRIPPWQVKVREDVFDKVKAFNHRVTNPNRYCPSRA